MNIDFSCHGYSDGDYDGQYTISLQSKSLRTEFFLVCVNRKKRLAQSSEFKRSVYLSFFLFSSFFLFFVFCFLFFFFFRNYPSIIHHSSLHTTLFHQVSSDDEAIQLMNDSPYGLTASIWTNAAENPDSETVFLKFADELQTGTVFLNR